MGSISPGRGKMAKPKGGTLSPKVTEGVRNPYCQTIRQGKINVSIPRRRPTLLRGIVLYRTTQ